MAERTRVGFILTAACVLLLLVVGAFWYQEGQYLLPTPRPPRLTQTAVGLPLALPAEILQKIQAVSSRPTLLHFFNPACPCSRFNLDHIRQLRAAFRDKANLLIVVEGGKGSDPEADLRREGLDAPVIADPSGEIAGHCGIYSTPQAVILDADGR